MSTITLNPEESAQLTQTIDMFEVIVQSQPADTQSLEILKEAYLKLGREEDVIHTSKRIAQGYLQQGQLSSAILEYETVLQRRPDDGDVRLALKEIEQKAGGVSAQPLPDNFKQSAASLPSFETSMRLRTQRVSPVEEVDDGRKTMYKIYVESKLISEGDFDLCWQKVDLTAPPMDVLDPFIATLQARDIVPLEKSLRLLCERSRSPFLPLDRYEFDTELARSFPVDVCRRWCVLPFDRMSKSILVATANPFNQQAAKELAAVTGNRLLWYVASPADLTASLRKVFR